MVCFKARQHFQDSNGEIDFFTEAGTKKKYAVLYRKKRLTFQIEEQTT